MRRRTWAAVLAVVLVVGLSVLAARKPVPYATFSPGPTVNVLGKSGKSEIITVEGRKSYHDDGALRLTTIIASGAGEKISIAELVTAWIDPDRAVYPYTAVHAPTDTRESVREQSAVQMVSSQDNAVAAALGAMNIPFTSAVKIAQVSKDGPADGQLKNGDLVLSVNGKKVSTLDELTGTIRPLKVGSEVTVKVRRDGRELEKRMTTTASPQDKKLSALLVSIAPSYEFPFEVDLRLDDNIGGPSGGLMFALGIYDVLTPGSLTGGKAIAGSGEIDAQGEVGGIGGIQQKVVGAQDSGAGLFLVPAENCAEALGGHYDPDKIRLVKVTTLKEAIEDVQAWVKDSDATMARCTR